MHLSLKLIHFHNLFVSRLSLGNFHRSYSDIFVSATDKQLGGYVVEYDRMTFAIVHGAGHLVPGERPWHALDLLSTFLIGGSLAA